ncbi:hypothetical protein D9M72_491280 [compost metagenome]
MAVDEQPVGVRKRCAVKQGRAADDSRRKHPQPVRGHAGAQVFGENGKPFLHALVTRKPGAEDPEALRRAVEVG